MRGFGQIAELTAIGEPDVGVITNIGPVHLEQMGSLEGVARGQGGAARGPLRRRDGGRALRRAAAGAVAARRRSKIVTFGPGGDVALRGRSLRGGVGARRAALAARGDRATASGSSSSCRSTRRHNLLNTLAAVAAARAVGVHARRRASTCASAACAASGSLLGTGATVINDCYNANPLSMRAALDDLATTRPPAGASRCSATCSSSAPPRTSTTASRRLRRARRASTCSSPSARAPRRCSTPSTARRYAVADARGGRRAAPASCSRRATCVLVKGSRGVGLEVVAEALARGGRLMGEVLIAGTASLLICIFLSPKFISFLRAREFGQQIREEGPQEHHAKAGTPTMGGIIIFTAIAVPFLLLTDFDAALGRRLRRRDRVRAARLRRRLREDRPAPLARPAGAHEAVVTVADLGRAVARRDRVGGPARHAQPADHRRPDRPRAPLPGLHLPRGGGHDVGGQPHRRARRPRRRLRGDRAARLHRDHVHDAPDRPRAGGRLPRRRVRRLPVVQLVPGLDLHGRHRARSASAARSRRWR